MSSETELGSDVIVRCESLHQRWTSTFPGRMDVSTPGAFRYFRTLAEPTVGGISLNVDNFIVRELPSLEAQYPGGHSARLRFPARDVDRDCAYPPDSDSCASAVSVATYSCGPAPLRPHFSL